MVQTNCATYQQAYIYVRNADRCVSTVVVFPRRETTTLSRRISFLHGTEKATEPISNVRHCHHQPHCTLQNISKSIHTWFLSRTSILESPSIDVHPFYSRVYGTVYGSVSILNKLVKFLDVAFYLAALKTLSSYWPETLPGGS